MSTTHRVTKREIPAERVMELFAMGVESVNGVAEHMIGRTVMVESFGRFLTGQVVAIDFDFGRTDFVVAGQGFEVTRPWALVAF